MAESPSPPASPPITRLPTQLIWKILPYLNMNDIRNLRLSSRWLEHQSFGPFTERFFKILTITMALPLTERAVAMMAKVPLREHVKTLKVFFRQATEQEALPPKKEAVKRRFAPAQQQYRRSRALATPDPQAEECMPQEYRLQNPTVDLLSLVEGLPRIHALTLYSVGTEHMHTTLRPLSLRRALTASSATITTLTLESAVLTSGHLKLLLSSLQATLTDLTLKHIVCLDNSWPSVLHPLHSLPSLSTCHLGDLREGRNTIKRHADGEEYEDEMFLLLPEGSLRVLAQSPEEHARRRWQD